MARINLLPWREEKRNEQQKQFASIAALSVVFVGFVILAVHLQYSRMIDYQTSRNAFLKREISKVDKQIKEIRALAKEKNRLLARMQVIQRLQNNRPEIVHVMDELVRIMPDGTYLLNYTQKGKKITISALAQSNARVSALMRNISTSIWFHSPRLRVIKKSKKDAEATRKFALTFRQARQRKAKPKAPEVKK